MSSEPSATGWAGRDTLFVSYSHDDVEWMQAFQVMLGPMLDDVGVGVELWIDTEVQTGRKWHPEIEEAISRSGAALLLISSRFLTSSLWVPENRAHGT